MLEIGTAVLRRSLSILGETDEFGSTWLKPSSLSLAANSAMRLNLPLAHMVDSETLSNLLPLYYPEHPAILATCCVCSKR